MKNSSMEAWVWLLIYGGLLCGCLGYFVSRSDAALGWAMGVVGALAWLAGVLLIYLRSRRGP